MAWVRVEASVCTHPKFLDAGPAACWLWLCGVAYCQEGLTDGFIPFAALPHLGVRGAGNLKSKLVAVGLWEQVTGGWQVHGYLKHNRSAAEVQRIREERREAGAIGGKASGEARAKQLAEANTEANAKQPSKPSTATATEATTALLGSALFDSQPPQKKDKAAAPPRSRPIADDKGTPEENLDVITAIVAKELIPLGVIADELIEATKERCAMRKIAYDSQTVRKAVDSATARLRKVGF